MALTCENCVLCQGKALSEQEIAIERGDTAASANASARVLLLNQQLDQVIYIYIYMYICIYICIYVYIYICIHMYRATPS